MAQRSVITITTGEAGSGKSYARCAQFIVDRFLKDHDGPHISNFPLGEVPEDHSEPPAFDDETFADRIAAAASKAHGLDELQTRERIQTIPADVLASWESGQSGPWDYFDGVNLQDAHVAIDEIHNYCDAQGDAKLRKRWKQWIGEIRHQGATVEFLSQALAKVPIELRREAGLHIEVKNTETERDPIFGVTLGDWYELRAAFITGRYSSNVMERERRSAMGEPSRRGWADKRLFPLDPWYFRFYDSFSAPQKGGNKGRAQRRQFERRSRLGLLAWFVFENAGRLVPRFALYLAVAWLLVGHYVGLGGGPWVVEKAIGRMQSYGRDVVDGAARGMSVAPDAMQPQSPEKVRRREVVDQVVQERPADEAVVPAEVLEAVKGLRAELEAAQAENQVLREAIERTAELAAIGRDSVTFRNGFTYRVGEVIDYGPFNGRKVLRINWRRRLAELDDGAVLRLGGGVERSTADRLLDAVKPGQQ